MRTRAGWLVIGLLAELSFARGARGFYLDAGRRFDVRMRAYSQLGILTQDSDLAGCPTEGQLADVYAQLPGRANRTARLTQLGKLLENCAPRHRAGDLAQHRNFYNPEFDANLTDFMKWSGADRFKFRFAWWGFYDGLYDYLDPRWDDNRRALRGRYAQSDDPRNESFKFRDHNKNPRHIYAHWNRLNELYFDYTRGPLFVRVGRQGISWGESDGIALLDISNPFDLTLGVPGFFQDVDEARIPLWTLPRVTYQLFEKWGPISGGLAEAYFVPGVIQPTNVLGPTVPINPIPGGVTPFGPPQSDAQWRVWAQGQGNSIHNVFVDRLPERSWGNSRWGVRLEGLLFRNYTVQGWFFRTFSQAPVPLATNASAIDLLTQKRGTVIDDRGFRVPTCVNNRTPAGRFCSYAAPAVTILERQLQSVVGLAATWFSQPVNGILKAEVEFFIGEPAFIPTQNANPRVQIPASIRKSIGDTKKYANSTPKANYLRWVFGYDRNFFWRALNPANSFILVASYTSQINVTEWGTGKDFRLALPKPGHPATRTKPIPGVAACQGAAARGNLLCTTIDPRDYVDSYAYDGFLQATVRTDYMHGRLTPQLTFIADVHGYYGLQPAISYRINDNVYVGATYSMISASWPGNLGAFRNSDILQLRVTGQFN
jgi:hypothetical protein